MSAVRRFDWEKRYEHEAWRVTDAEMGHRFDTALAEGGLPAQFLDVSSPAGPIFWWDRKLTAAESGICEKALALAIGELPPDAS